MNARKPLGLVFFVALVVAALAALTTPARALEHNFAGSAQLDYTLAPTTHGAVAYPNAFDGFTMEFAAKIAVDFSDKVSANMKVCYGCHGFEADMMYFDVRIADELNFRVGRFSPSFGAFNLRHDPANHRLSDKPLPYDMGRMLRLRQWNMSVLPSPFPDNGIEVDGSHFFGQATQLDYAVYGVSGFKGEAQPLDIDYRLSRRPEYYVDNNTRPTVGARLAMTVRLGESSDVSGGASAMYGTYDPQNKQSYAIGGVDLSLRLDRTILRAEYLLRRTTFDTTDPLRFKYLVSAVDGDYFVKEGGYVEIEQGLTPELDLLGRVDNLRRRGNVEAGSELSSSASILRYTVGGAYAIERGLRIKVSTELWRFSDRDGTTGRKSEVSMHASLAGSF